MAKEKRKLTVREKQKKYDRISKLTFAGEYVATLTPFVVLGAVNFEEWFLNDSGWKVGIGASIAMALVAIATALITKKKEDTTITNGFISLCLVWYAVAFIFVLLDSIIHDIAKIMLISGSGMLAAAGLNVVSNTYKKKSDTLKDILGETEKDLFKEQAMKELEEEEKAKDDGTSI